MPEQCAALIDALIALRKERGWSQQELSEACGLTQSVVARIECKKSSPTIITLYKIVSALGADLMVEKTM